MSPEFTLIAGPCVIESESLGRQVTSHLAELGERLKMQVLVKASFYKANRTSGSSFREPGLQRGLQILERVLKVSSLAVLTDVREIHQTEPTAEVVDVLEIPAFLYRQNDLLQSCGSAAQKHTRTVNVKKVNS